jgi:elongation factor G
MSFDSADLRNVVLLGHAQCGKTSLGDALLFSGGATNRLGKVMDGTSLLDFEPEEVERQRTYVSAIAVAEWKKKKITLLDTPGDSNFLYDTRTCAYAADTACVVLSAVDGVEFGTERVWELCKELGLARVLFVSKMDKERADFDAALAGAVESFGAEVAALQIPIGKEVGFQGVVDVLRMKAYVYKKGDAGEFTVEDVPAALAGAAGAAREKLVEAIASADDKLLEKYLETMELSEDEIGVGLRAAVAKGALVPVLCGSGTGNVGVKQLMDLLAEVYPSPAQRPPAKGHKPGDAAGAEETRRCSADEPFSAICFKTIVDPFSGKLSVLRIRSGKLTSDSGAYNATKKTRERWGPLLVIKGKKQEPVKEAAPGDIVAVAKLKDTLTGDTLCDEKAPIEFALPAPDPARMSFAVKPKSKGDEDKVSSALTRLREEDPSLLVTRDESKDLILNGAGDTHLRIAAERMKRKYGVEVDLTTPRIPYRETIKGRATDVEGKHKKQSGGRGQFGVVYIDVEPLPRGTGFEFADKIFGGSIPRQFIPAVEKGIQQRMTMGAIAGYPIVDVRVSLKDGKYHDVDSDAFSFERAGSKALKAAFDKITGKALLEPVMTLEVAVPDECMGEVLGDINSRRGRVLGMDSRGKAQVIKAAVPMSEVQDYSAKLKSMTQDRGTFILAYSHYDEVPPHIAEKVIAAAGKLVEEDEE